MKHLFATATAIAMAFTAPAFADSWTLDGDASRLTFGSVKKDYIGEVHHFSGLSGTVAADGSATIEIDLGSIETYVDIRNERMAEHVFKMAPTANLATTLDMEALENLAVGDVMSMDLDGDLTLLGNEVYVPVEVTVARLGEDKVLVMSDIAYVATDELGIDAGVDKLMEIADLPGITRAVPVSFKMIFTADGQGA